jgi:serine/threonine-protein kinase HipA
MRTLVAYLDDRRIGTLHEGEDLWAFEYDAGWIQAPDAFDLSPALSRARRVHRDGGSDRPVQWYFDNLLPEESLREIVSKEADIRGEDAFALLQYLGAESAGSLVLLPPDAAVSAGGGLRRLPDAALCARIRELPRRSLSAGAPKRMSLAGAQNKLLAVFDDDGIAEPIGNEPSTHILKPNHLSDDYPASVINEYVCMRLAAAVGLQVPPVFRRYTPEPVYIVERFDRLLDAGGRTRRRHIIDACQLLNKPAGFKYRGATLESLADVIAACNNRASTRMRLFRWLVFNLLVANNDNHLKNLSFLVRPEGIELAPAYDLLSTGSYHTKALANERATWPAVDLAIALPGARRLHQVARDAVLAAGEALGLPARIGARELDRMAAALPPALAAIGSRIAAENAHAPGEVRRFLGAEMMLIRVMQHLVVPEMIGRLAPPAARP